MDIFRTLQAVDVEITVQSEDVGQVGVLEEHYWQQIRVALDIVLGFAP